MPKLRLEQVVHETEQGRYITRPPKDISDILTRKILGQLTDGTLDQVAEKLPNIFKGNQARLREGANIEEPTLYERLDRKIPLLDLHRIPWLVGSIGMAALTYHAAKYGAEPNSVYHGIHETLNDSTPEILSLVINAVNKQLFFVKGDYYMNAALLGAVSTAALGYGLFKGLLPWRADQVKWKKSHVAELEEKIAEGTQPVQYVGHVVGLGMRDPLVWAEMEDEVSFTRHLKQNFGEIVLIQRDPEYWRPKNLGLELNSDNMYVNLPEILKDAPSLPETLSHVIISGVYQAGGLIINGQREFELFEKSFVDTFDDSGRLNYSLAADTLKNANLIRQIVFEESPPLRSVVITPKYLSPKEGFSHKEGDSWKYTVQANFLTAGKPDISGVICPEDVFLEMVYNELDKRDALQKTIYIDSEGQRDAAGKAERCKNELENLYASKGLCGEDMPKILTDPSESKEAEVSIVLRSKNRYTSQSAAINRFEHDHQLVLFATSQREQTITNINQTENRRRVPINYKAEIARLTDELLTGGTNQCSLQTLVDNGVLRRYTA